MTDTRPQVLARRLGKAWRVFATGLCFTVFGIGGLLMWLLIFPLIDLTMRQPQRRVRAARNVIQLAFRGFVELMRLVGVIRYEITGLERLRRNGLLILANHPTLIDTVLLMAFVRQADCIVKSALWRNPFTRGPVRAAGYISNAQGPELVEDCINAIRNGGNLIIFPEGTRTPVDGSISFKRGAANVAVRGDCAITPVVIRCTPGTLSKGRKWWDVPDSIAHFRIEVRPDIQPGQAITQAMQPPQEPGPAVTQAVAHNDNPTLAARQLTHFLQHYFMKES